MSGSLQGILDRIAAGETLVISNHLRAFQVDRRVLARFAKTNSKVLVEDRFGHIWMASGRRRVDVTYCKFTFYR